MASRQVGRKDDAQKPRWDLVPWPALAQVVAVLTIGAAKYGDQNWRLVANGRDRYFAALLRHLVAWRTGERIDAESHRPHLAHVVCNALFLLTIDGESKT